MSDRLSKETDKFIRGKINEEFARIVQNTEQAIRDGELRGVFPPMVFTVTGKALSKEHTSNISSSVGEGIAEQFIKGGLALWTESHMFFEYGGERQGERMKEIVREAMSVQGSTTLAYFIAHEGVAYSPSEQMNKQLSELHDKHGDLSHEEIQSKIEEIKNSPDTFPVDVFVLTGAMPTMETLFYMNMIAEKDNRDAEDPDNNDGLMEFMGKEEFQRKVAGTPMEQEAGALHLLATDPDAEEQDESSPIRQSLEGRVLETLHRFFVETLRFKMFHESDDPQEMQAEQIAKKINKMSSNDWTIT